MAAREVDEHAEDAERVLAEMLSARPHEIDASEPSVHRADGDVALRLLLCEQPPDRVNLRKPLEAKRPRARNQNDVGAKPVRGEYRARPRRTLAQIAGAAEVVLARDVLQAELPHAALSAVVAILLRLPVIASDEQVKGAVCPRVACRGTPGP